jgi:acyl-CoA hydrolase
VTKELAADALDLTRLVRRGDTVLWPQGTAEPLTLTEALVRQRQDVGPANVFIGITFSETLQPEHADWLTFTSYAGTGANQRLSRAGALNILPSHYSQLPQLFASGEIKCDVAFLQLSGANDAGAYSFGVGHDYVPGAARRARVVIAEVNDQAPWTFGAQELSDLRIDFVVRTSRPLLQLAPQAIGETERRIAMHCAQYIADGAVLEIGIGAIPDAILSGLANRRELGVHSGAIGDSIVDLIEAGAITNVRKGIDRGVTVTGVLFGTERLYRFAHENPSIRLRPPSYTHDARILAQLDNFIAINSAIEVDLTGQVNAEQLGGHYMGAVGGQGDFVRAAIDSHGGRSIIALPSTAKRGTLTRIVPQLSGGITTTARSDADLIVTEWGVAELRGQTVKERVRRMIAIAHPAFREQLERDAHQSR